jgi:hypothetical protein
MTSVTYVALYPTDSILENAPEPMAEQCLVNNQIILFWDYEFDNIDWPSITDLCDSLCKALDVPLTTVELFANEIEEDVVSQWGPGTDWDHDDLASLAVSKLDIFQSLSGPSERLTVSMP